MRRDALQVLVTDGRGRRVPSAGLGPWLVRHAPRAARGTVSIALVSDAAMRRLNKSFRGRDQVTDVLSFPSDRRVRPGSPKRLRRVDGLGDIAIATGVARRQARELGHSVGTELRVLALHGLLHLLGYDHDADQGDMRKLEERLRRRAGLPDGLIARADRPRSASRR